MQKSKPKERVKRLKLPAFLDYKITVVLTDNVAKTSERTFRDTDAGQAMHFWKHGESTLIFPHKPEAGIIAHECWHCIFRLFKFAGAEIENEIAAYHLGWLVDQVSTFAYPTVAK